MSLIIQHAQFCLYSEEEIILERNVLSKQIKPILVRRYENNNKVQNWTLLCLQCMHIIGLLFSQ